MGLKDLIKGVTHEAKIRGTTVRIRPMSIMRAIELEAVTQNGQGEKQLDVEHISIVKDIVAESIVDDESELIDSAPLDLVMELFTAICEISGLTPSAQDTTAKNCLGRQSRNS